MRLAMSAYDPKRTCDNDRLALIDWRRKRKKLYCDVLL
jgi:hypothetical protein